MKRVLLEILTSKDIIDLKSIHKKEKIVEVYTDIQSLYIECCEINKISRFSLSELSLNGLVPFSHIFNFDVFGSLEEHIHDRAKLSNGTYVHSKKGKVIGTMRDKPLISFSDSESIFVMEDEMKCYKAFDNVVELAKVMIILNIMLLKNIDFQDFEDLCLSQGIGIKNISTFKKIKDIDEI